MGKFTLLDYLLLLGKGVLEIENKMRNGKELLLKSNTLVNFHRARFNGTFEEKKGQEVFTTRKVSLNRFLPLTDAHRSTGLIFNGQV